MEDQYLIKNEDELFGEDWLQSFATEILDAKYDLTEVKDVINKLDHLNENQKKDLLNILKKNQTMFDGTLGVYPHKKFILILNLMQNQYTHDLIRCQEYT